MACEAGTLFKKNQAKPIWHWRLLKRTLTKLTIEEKPEHWQNWQLKKNLNITSWVCWIPLNYFSYSDELFIPWNRLQKFWIQIFPVNQEMYHARKLCFHIPFLHSYKKMKLETEKRMKLPKFIPILMTVH